MAVAPKGKKWFTVIEEPSKIQGGWSSLSHGTLPGVWRLPRRQLFRGPTVVPRLLGAHSPGLRSTGGGLSLPRKERR